MISKATQFVVPLANKPGTLARLCSVLGDAQVNIIGVFVPETEGTAQAARVMVVDVDTARATLRKAKIRFSEEEVLDVELDNRPGAFGELAGKLSKEKINITHAYATTAPFARARVVVAVSDIRKAMKALKEKNVWDLSPPK
jgi:hypothetical protein